MYYGIYQFYHWKALHIESIGMEYPHINDVILHHSVKNEE